MTPGQHLQAISAAFFNGGGWVDPLTWDDFDEAGHAKWEEFAETIGRNIRAASAAPYLLTSLKALREEICGVDQWWGKLREAVDAADDALVKAEPLVPQPHKEPR